MLHLAGINFGSGALEEKLLGVEYVWIIFLLLELTDWFGY
jgi:hypothetical protein